MRILIIGDSNTFGFNGQTRERLKDRYPVLLTKETEHEIIAEGLNGRTIARDDPFDEDRNALKNASMLVKSHLPLDCIIINLGTNDTKRIFNTNKHTLDRGMQTLLSVLTNPNLYRAYPNQKVPKLLVIHPTRMDPLFAKNEDTLINFGQEAFDLLEQEDLFQNVANEFGAEYLDPMVRADPFDAIHLNEEGHRIVADAIKKKLEELS